MGPVVTVQGQFFSARDPMSGYSPRLFSLTAEGGKPRPYSTRLFSASPTSRYGGPHFSPENQVRGAGPRILGILGAKLLRLQLFSATEGTSSASPSLLYSPSNAVATNFPSTISVEKEPSYLRAIERTTRRPIPCSAAFPFVVRR